MQPFASFYVTLTVLFELVGQSTSNLDTPSPTPCEGGLSFCETTEDYPTDYIDQLMKKQPESILKYFNKPVEAPWSVSNRNFDGMDLCPSKSREIYPTAANWTDEKTYIVNTDKNRQGVMIEECKYTKECPIIKDLTLKYKSACRQKTMWRTMVVYDPKNKLGMVTKEFEFPIGCLCSVTPVHPS